MAFMFPKLIHSQAEEVTPHLYRGQDPKVAQIYELHDKGIKTIISLRTNPELKKQRLCENLGMKWVQIKTGIFRTPSPAQFDQFRALVNNPSNWPCYTSCEIDMDRTGVYIAAYRMVDQHRTEAQMDDEFRAHHQKTWWPIFRKYSRLVATYAKSRSNQELQTASASDSSPSSSERSP